MNRTSASKPSSHILPSSCSASPRTLGLAVVDERTVKEDSMREDMWGDMRTGRKCTKS